MKKNARPTEVKAGALDKRPKHSTPPTLLVTLDHGEVWTTSLLVAEKFGKQHKDVLRAIEKKACSEEFRQRNFAPAEYLDEQSKPRRMYRLSRDGFALVVMGFTGESAVSWQERFIDAFNQMERELRRIVINRAQPDWNEARQLGKIERRELTDAVQLLCERAHERNDSTTPLATWAMSATRTVTRALFETNAERIAAIRERLTARQLRRLAMAEQVYADALLNCLDSDLHHRAINEQARVSVLDFSSVTGGREVPGVDRRAVGALYRQSGFVASELAGLLVLAVVAGLMLLGGA